MLNKRGQGLSTNMIVIIILAVIVLVILVLAFTGVFDDLLPWINPDNNVGDVVSSCATYCSLGEAYNFCNKQMDLYTDDADYKGSCYTYSLISDPFSQFGVATCPTANCEDTVNCVDWSYEVDGESRDVGSDYNSYCK